MISARSFALPLMGFILLAILQLGFGQDMAIVQMGLGQDVPPPSPAPSPSLTSDGTAIDQGIAYFLLLLALAVTYLLH